MFHALAPWYECLHHSGSCREQCQIWTSPASSEQRLKILEKILVSIPESYLACLLKMRSLLVVSRYFQDCMVDESSFPGPRGPVCALSPVRVFQVLNALTDHANKPRKTTVCDMKELQNANQPIGKKTISKGFGLGRLHHSSECHLNHSRLGMLHTITSSRWRPKQKVTSVFPGFFRKWNGFCLDPKKQRAVLVVAAKEKKNVTAGNYTPKGPPTMSRVWRRTWHFKVRGFDHLQKQWFLVNRKPHHKKNTESHLVHTFYRSVFLLTFNVLWWKWVICLDPENCHTHHHSFAGFQRLNEAAWFMDDGFAHPFIVSWSKAKHCEMREQCTVCNWEKNTWYKRLRWNQPFSFIMTDASRFHMISSNSSLHLHPICTRNIVEYLALQKKIWRCHPCTVLPPNLRTFSGILC